MNFLKTGASGKSPIGFVDQSSGTTLLEFSDLQFSLLMLDTIIRCNWIANE